MTVIVITDSAQLPFEVKSFLARRLFPEFQGGEGEGRGREVVRRHRGEAAYLDFPPSALADLDAPEDLERARRELGGDP